MKKKISFIFFLSFFALSNAKMYEIEVTSLSQYVQGAEVKVIQNGNEYIQITDTYGMAKFNLDDDKVFVKVIKKGYEPKGYLGLASNLSLELKSIKVTLSGKIFADGKLIEQEIILVDLTSKREYSTMSVNGLFNFSVPMLKKHAFKVVREGFAEYYEKFKLYSDQSVTREIHLKRNETKVVILTRKDTKRVIVEEKELIIDFNGFATVILKNFNKDFIQLCIDNNLYERRIERNSVNIISLY